MKISSHNRHIDIDKDYALESLPKFSVKRAFSHLELAQSIIFAMEPYLAKIVQIIANSPECDKDEKFWIEAQVHRLISYYTTWFRSIIKTFETKVVISRVPANEQIIVEIRLLLEFVKDENNYTHSYTFIKIQER